MAETMIERVGRAIDPEAWATQEGLRTYSPDYWASPVETERRRDLVRRALAAITAMREPTEAMRQRGNLEPVMHSWRNGGGEFITAESAGDVWQAMVDGALKESE